MTSGAYYNEHDPNAAAWLRELIKQGHIADGDVDERSIIDVRPDDIRRYAQCHFFAGIGVWSYALRQAGWPDDRPVWTGSCPCQPFSAAGAGAGFADERHLWPHFHWLISQCRPGIILGEQVASKDGLGWLDLVQADMEGEGYACGAVDTCAAGFGAPHIRQRLYWVAERLDNAASARHVGALEDAEGNSRHEARLRVSGKGRGPCGLADADGRQSGEAGRLQSGGQHGLLAEDGRSLHGGWPRSTNGYWRDADWLFCRDGKWRPVEPGTFPLANGASARVVRLRGYGNAIVAPQATAFVEAVMETVRD